MHNNISMYKIVVFLGFLFFSITTKAHQPDISTTMLVEKADNTWILQIRASLTAFQQEIKTHFADTPYKTPEEFKAMVLEHITNNLQVIFNEEDESITLKNGYVKLGHETNVVFEISGIPTDIKNIEVKNSSFNDIYKSQSALVILKEGYSKERFILNNKNNYTLKLKTIGNKFIDFQSDKTNKSSYPLIVLLLIGVMVLGIVFQKKYKRKKVILN